jgi:hypothetical protein
MGIATFLRKGSWTLEQYNAALGTSFSTVALQG